MPITISRKSTRPVTPEMVVLAEVFSIRYVSISIKVIYTLSREDGLQ